LYLIDPALRWVFLFLERREVEAHSLCPASPCDIPPTQKMRPSSIVLKRK
jgi:hypothetical protein